MTFPVLTPALLATLAALALVYLFADSFAGGSMGEKLKALDKQIPGRAAFWGALLAAIVGRLTLGPAGALLALAWFAYRTPGWDLIGGQSSINPVGVGPAVATFIRHLLPIILVVPIAYWTHGPSLPHAAAAVAVYAALATALGLYYGAWSQQHVGALYSAASNRLNGVIEKLRGALYGLVVGGAFLFLS